MKILVIGANGQLGSDVVRAAERAGHQAVPFRGRHELDVTRAEEVSRALAAHRPDAVMNAAARCDVDACETDSARAWEVNALGARHVAQACRDQGSRLLHVSTDYVFSGDKDQPYVETDLPRPLNTYGITKLAGEHFALAYGGRTLVVRTSGLYGIQGSREKGGNFVETMVRLSAVRPEIRLACDQVLSPTSTRDLSETLLGLAGLDLCGVVHVCNRGACSWLEWATEIFRLLGRDVRACPVPLDSFGLQARRPRYSALESLVFPRIGIPPLPHWQDALARYLREARHLPDSVLHS
ncbi:MAG: dTDP-4-dehydrorhamnose reductase [Planctomycetes bacterium]|nr:dTDP-4-dehydrorhamnose reductase [Planctomycetota bacterium]